MNNKCIVCNLDLYDMPLLVLENMPYGAQNLPTTQTLSTDKGIEIEVCQCPMCGLIQLNNAPVSYYKQVIRATSISKEMRKFRQSEFKNFLHQHSLLGRKLVEIGCGCGDYLSILSEAGAKAYGIEDSKNSVQSCIKKGLMVSQGFIDDPDYELSHGPFDAFCIMSFLEHLPNPNATLQGICNNLTEDAVGLVEVPNFDMILRSNLFSEFVSDHLLYFTRKTLIQTLSRNGFEVINCCSIWHDYILSATVRKRKPNCLAEFSSLQNKICKKLHEYIDRFPPGRVAVWGAGHQALTILALPGLKDRVRYVVDSAEFKQGRFTPSTHIPIVAPETLRENSVDAIIVMSAAYSNEVASIVQADYSNIRYLAVLGDTGVRELY
jgi:2-polyprenyl-3-methyl-5-hydroxy-6-metoxy-1,4-benzoquinol methylase